MGKICYYVFWGKKIFWGKFPDGEKLKELARRLPKLINLDQAADGSR